MKPIPDHLRQNVVAYLALFVALGGTSYAAASLPAGSVGSRQLKNHSVTPIKLDRHSIGAYVRAWAVIKNGNRVVASRPHARVVSWDPHTGGDVVSWGSALTRNCLPLTTGGQDLLQAAILPGPGRTYELHLGSYTTAGQPDPDPVVSYVAVVCPVR